MARSARENYIQHFSSKALLGEVTSQLHSLMESSRKDSLLDTGKRKARILLGASIVALLEAGIRAKRLGARVNR